MAELIEPVASLTNPACVCRVPRHQPSAPQHHDWPVMVLADTGAELFVESPPGFVQCVAAVGRRFARVTQRVTGRMAVSRLGAMSVAPVPLR